MKPITPHTDQADVRIRSRSRGVFYTILCVAGLLLYGVGGGVGGQQSDSPAIVTIAPIHGEINRAQVILLRRAVEQAREQGADYFIVEIDTFGGRVDSALQLTTLIGSLQDIRTIAFVPVTSEGTGVSWSAGALISLSCDQIFMSPGTSIGAATPVTQQTDGTVAAGDEKILSAVRTQMAALAEKNGYSLGVALAMVDRDVELFEAYRDGELQGVYTQGEFDTLQAQNDDELERGKTVSEKGKLLTLTAGQMETYGVSSGSPSSYDALYALLEEDGVSPQEIRVENDGLDNFVAFLTSGAVVSLLVVAGLIGLFLEITSPGFGIPGALGLLAFAIVFGANFMLGRVGSLELLLLLCGVVLIMLELFLIPGFGVAGISGIVLVGISLVLAQQNFTIPRFDWQWRVLGWNILSVMGALVGGLIVFLSLTPAVSHGYLFRRIALTDTQQASAGYTVQTERQRDALLGKQGVTISTLRPSGRALFGDDILIVESNGEFIEGNVPIRVTQVDSNRIRVRRVKI